MEYNEHQVDDQVKEDEHQVEEDEHQVEEDEHQVEEDEHQVEDDEVVWVYVFTLLFIHYSKLLK